MGRIFEKNLSRTLDNLWSLLKLLLVHQCFLGFSLVFLFLKMKEEVRSIIVAKSIRKVKKPPQLERRKPSKIQMTKDGQDIFHSTD